MFCIYLNIRWEFYLLICHLKNGGHLVSAHKVNHIQERCFSENGSGGGGNLMLG
jgi:hypothetical protein